MSATKERIRKKKKFINAICKDKKKKKQPEKGELFK